MRKIGMQQTRRWPDPLLRLAHDVLQREKIRCHFLALSHSEPIRRQEILESWLAELAIFSVADIKCILKELSSTEDFFALLDFASEDATRSSSPILHDSALVQLDATEYASKSNDDERLAS